jgi:hypothetical protein
MPLNAVQLDQPKAKQTKGRVTKVSLAKGGGGAVGRQGWDLLPEGRQACDLLQGMGRPASWSWEPLQARSVSFALCDKSGKRSEGKRVLEVLPGQLPAVSRQSPLAVPQGV